MSRRHVAIVGGGPGGLAAAMLLARQDVDVTLFERQEHVGGRTSLIREGGFTFDTGPTFFLYPQVLSEIFAACGFDLAREVDLIRLDPQYRLQFEDGARIDATPDLARMAAQIGAISPGDAASFAPFMEENRRKFAAFMPVFRKPFESVFDLLTPSVLGALSMLRPTRSVEQELKRFFSDPRIRLAFSFQSKYLGMSPFRCPALFTILPFLEYEHGVFHPRGGCGGVMETMGRLARRMGVRIRTGEPVQEILVEGRRTTGVRTASGVTRADAVVVNADFAQAMKTLVPDAKRKRWTDRKLEKKKFSCSTFMMYLGVEREYPDLPHHTIFLTEDYKRNVEEIEGGEVLTETPSFYVQNASVTDKTLAPRGSSTLYVLVPVPHRTDKIDWSDVQHYRARTLARMRQVGIDVPEDAIRVERLTTPKMWEEDHGLYRGATFSLRHSLNQMLQFRPHNRFEDVDGVYLVGGGTHPGSGLPVIFESARISTALLAEDLGLHAAPSGSHAAAPAMVYPEMVDADD